jgi:rRNA processing protein Krr1/Pno1
MQMHTAEKKSQNLSLELAIDPLYDFNYYGSNLLSDINSLLVQHFYSKPLAKKVYVILSELLNNVVDHIEDKSSSCKIKLDIDPEGVVIKVKNKVDKDQYDKVKSHIMKIKNINDQKAYFSEIVTQRREKGLTGGLGYARLFIENTNDISISYDRKKSYMTVTSKLRTGSEI